MSDNRIKYKNIINAGGKTSLTAAVPAVITNNAFADDDEITIDIDAVGTTPANRARAR